MTVWKCCGHGSIHRHLNLLFFALWLFRNYRLVVKFISKKNQWIISMYGIFYSLAIVYYCISYLPIFDFRPYYIGANIKEQMSIPEGEQPPVYDTTFIMEKDGVRKEFTIDNYPDSTWTFIDSKTIQTAEGYVPPIHDFSIQATDGSADITDSVLNHKGYAFLLVSPHLEYADDSNFGEIDGIYEYSLDRKYPFYALTASTDEAIRHWRDITGAEYNFYHTDETTLKTVIRSNPGLLLIKDGTVIGKWSHNDLPELDEKSPALEKTEYGTMTGHSAMTKISRILLWYILPLVLLSLADRTWQFTRWIRQKEHSNKIYQLLKGKKKNEKENCSR